LGYFNFHQDITFECIRAFYVTADADEEEINLHEKGTVESEHDNDFGDGDNWGNGYGLTY
jgi:hypothetical protein